MHYTNKTKVFTLFCYALFFIPSISIGAVFTAQIEGNWESPATWGETTLTPGVNDDVVIDGIKVYLSTATTINNLLITNTNASSESKLELSTNSGFLTINGNVNVTSKNVNVNVSLVMIDGSQILVNGDMTMERTSTNNHNKDLTLEMSGTSILTVEKIFKFDYKNSNGESKEEVKVTGDASLIVKGDAQLNMESGSNEFTFFLHDNASVEFQDNLSISQSGGDAFVFHVHGAGVNASVGESLTINNSGGQNPLTFEMLEGILAIDQNLSIASTSSLHTVLFDLSSNATELDINGNITINATDDESAGFTMDTGAKLYLGGDFIRNGTNKFGYLTMDNTSEFYFDGTSSQSIPQTSILSAGVDLLIFSNIIINNTSSNGITLTSDLLVTEDLILTEGIINTSDSTYLILDDGVGISAGNSNSYINGPMIKRGSTGGANFTFPVGNNGTFAPLTINPITDSNLEYTVQYIGCPPPIGLLNDPVKAINSSGHWEVERNDGAPVGNLSLHWDDADEVGIDDLSSLIVSYWDPVDGWFEMGRMNATGGIGPGISGSISNNIGCPPPIGIQTFAFGSTDPNKNAPLPVEMTNFRAYKNNDNSKTFIEWETSSEENSDYFAVEKSVDGVSFQEIIKMTAAGNSTTKKFYSTEDLNPQKGSNYYRIKQVDQDGMMDFTRLSHVFINIVENKPVIYPNPVNDYINLYSKDLKSNEEILVKIFDLQGECIHTEKINPQYGKLTLSTQKMNIGETGIYFISYFHNGQTHSLEFIKTYE